MLVENVVNGQIVKIVSGKLEGESGLVRRVVNVGQVRKIDVDKKMVTLLVGGKLKTVSVDVIEPESE